MAERNGTFASTFIKKLQQASSDDRILHKLCQYALRSAHQQLVSSGRGLWLLEKSLEKRALGSHLNSESIDSCTPAHFDLSVCPSMSLDSRRLHSPAAAANSRAKRVPSLPLPMSLYLNHSHCPVLALATLTALPSSRAIPDRDVLLCLPRRSVGEGGSLIPSAPLYLARSRSARPLPVAALPAMSLIPFAPFDEAGARNGLILTRCCAREHVKRPIFAL